VWLEHRGFRPHGPTLWFGGSSLHASLIRRLVAYGSGFNPLGQPLDEELAALAGALDEAGRSLDEIEMVGGLRGRFEGSHDVASVGEALERLEPQITAGYRIFCFKPSVFTDELDVSSTSAVRWCGDCRRAEWCLTRIVRSRTVAGLPKGQ
jgi:hypothetical protein